MPHPFDDPVATITDLYPHYTREEQVEAAENVRRCVEVCLRIFERLEADPEANARFVALTRRAGAGTVDITSSDDSSPRHPT